MSAYGEQLAALEATLHAAASNAAMAAGSSPLQSQTQVAAATGMVNDDLGSVTGPFDQPPSQPPPTGPPPATGTPGGGLLPHPPTHAVASTAQPLLHQQQAQPGAPGLAAQQHPGLFAQQPPPPFPRGPTTGAALPGFPGAQPAALYGFNQGSGYYDQAATQTDERRQKRLARNRESARQSRRRKKQYLEELEEKVSALADEIEAMRRQHLDESERVLQDMRAHRLSALMEATGGARGGAGGNAALAASGGLGQSVDDRAFAALEELCARFGADCEERRAVTAYQFEQLWALVLPPHMRFLLWMMTQPAEFYQKGRSAGGVLRAAKTNSTAASTAAGAGSDVAEVRTLGNDAALDASGSVLVGAEGGANSELWPLLCHELGLTQEQEEKVRQVQRRLRDNTEAWAEQRALAQLTQQLEQLQAGITSTCHRCHQRASQLRSVLSPVQMTNYLSWASRNSEQLSSSQLEEASIATALHQMGQAPEVAGQPGGGSELVMILLQKPSAELTIDEMTFLMNRVRAPTDSPERAGDPCQATVKPEPTDDAAMPDIARVPDLVAQQTPEPPPH